MTTAEQHRDQMTGGQCEKPERNWNRLRFTGWLLVAMILALPAIAMHFTEEVVWTTGDFLFAGIILGSIGLAVEITFRHSMNAAYRSGALVALSATLLLTWLNSAVGLIGSGANLANALYFAVLAIGISGCFVAGFHARGMAKAMTATAVAQALVTGLAIAFNWSEGEDQPLMVLGINAFFITLWAGAALLFQRSAKRPMA